MHADDLVLLTTRGDPPTLPLGRVAALLDVEPAQVVRWCWVGRFPPPVEVGRQKLWRRSEVMQIQRDGPAMVGFYVSLPHYDGIRLLKALALQELRAKKGLTSDTGTVFGRREGGGS